MNPNITQSKKFDQLHLIYHFTVTLKLRSQVAKYWKLGRYFPYCIRHRTIETTTVKLVIEKNSRIYWILFIQFMVGESRHFHFWSQEKPSPRYLSSPPTSDRKKLIIHTPRQPFFGKSLPTAGGSEGGGGVGVYASYYNHISLLPLMSKAI